MLTKLLGNLLAIGRAWNAIKVMDLNNLSPNYQHVNSNSTFTATKLSNEETQWQKKYKVDILEWFSTSGSPWDLPGSFKNTALWS